MIFWKKREVEHKVGLERKRQEFEIQQAKRETEVKVREENLAADKERFKAEMNFQREHLQSEIKSRHGRTATGARPQRRDTRQRRAVEQGITLVSPRITYFAKPEDALPGTAPPAGPNLAWLDKRVNEMRVKL